MASRFKNIISFSPRPYWREILAVLMLFLAIIFFRSERKELHDIIPHLLRGEDDLGDHWLRAYRVLYFIDGWDV